MAPQSHIKDDYCMSENNQDPLEQTEMVETGGNEATEPGFLHIEEKQAGPSGNLVASPGTSAASASARADNRVGTIEHLAARRAYPAIDVEAPVIRRQLSEMRTEITDLLIGLRLGTLRVAEIAERLIAVLNLGPVPQWQPV